MSADSYTEVSRQSWFGRLGKSFTGIIAGILFIAIAFFLLFWNEGRSVKRAKTLEEGAGIVTTVAADAVDPAHEGTLIHLSGFAETRNTPTDSMFGVSVNALKLIRSVEMYQWTESSRSEEKKMLGGGTETVTTYTYDKEWRSSLVSSSGFKVQEGHANPASMPVQPDTFRADPITLGAFTLPASVVASIGGLEPVMLDPDSVKIPDTGQRNSKVAGNEIYLGADPQAPQVGDLRITFQSVPSQDISIVAAQTRKTLQPYTSQAGGKIELVERGIVDAASMFASAQTGNRVITWMIRTGGFLLMLIGWNMLFRPLSVLADVVPMAGNLVGMGTGFVAFILAATFSLITVAVAWIVFRPVIGITLLVLAAGFIYLLAQRAKNRAA
jgi:hypothetical protein